VNQVPASTNKKSAPCQRETQAFTLLQSFLYLIRKDSTGLLNMKIYVSSTSTELQPEYDITHIQKRNILRDGLKITTNQQTRRMGSIRVTQFQCLII
jgi:hypothetical protein